MAAIDKIYGTYDEWIEFHAWVARNKRPQYCKYFYPTPKYGETGPLTNFPLRADTWIYSNCQIRWVKERIRKQYNGSPLRKKKP